MDNMEKEWPVEKEVNCARLLHEMQTAEDARSPPYFASSSLSSSLSSLQFDLIVMRNVLCRFADKRHFRARRARTLLT